MSDHAALIAEARDVTWCNCGHYREPQIECGDHGDSNARLIASLADALEAAQQEVAALTEEADRAIDQANNLAGDVATLEAVQQTPAVDTDALAYWLWFIHIIGTPKQGAEAWADMSAVMKSLYGRQADRILASGILQDAAEVEARGLERLIDRVTDDGLVQMFGGEKFVSVALLVSEARAQQVREGKATRDTPTGIPTH